MLLLLLIYVVLRALWKIDVYLISTLVNKSLYYYYYRPNTIGAINYWSRTHTPAVLYVLCQHVWGHCLRETLVRMQVGNVERTASVFFILNVTGYLFVIIICSNLLSHQRCDVVIIRQYSSSELVSRLL